MGRQNAKPGRAGPQATSRPCHAPAETRLGHGFEQAFYIKESIESAVQKAVDSKLLSPEEALAEKQILLHFSPKLSVLRDQASPKIASFKNRLANEAQKIVPIVQELVRFSETKASIRLPLFLIPNPEEGNGGGGFNCGRLVLEVQDQPDPLPYLFHECLHALLWQHKDQTLIVPRKL